MPSFKFQARDAAGKSVSGNCEAESSTLAANQLLAKGLTPVKIEEVKAKKKGGGKSLLKIDILPAKVKTNDLIILCRQLSSLSRAGVPILNILRRLSETAKNPTLQKTLLGLADKIASGQTFAAALESYPKIFPIVFVSIVRAGENSGQLEEAYMRLANYLELEQTTARRIKSATRYPIIVICAIAIAMIVVNVFVIPAFAKMFEGFDTELPLPTRILLSLSGFMINNGVYLIIGFVVGMFFLRRYIKTTKGRYYFDKFKLNMPVIGSILHRSYIGRFARGFALMTRAGVPLVQAIKLVSDMVGNAFVAKKLELMQLIISKGGTLTSAAVETDMFSPLAIQMLSVGEESGSLEEMMMQVAEFYEKEVDYDLDRLDQMLEPIMLGIMGVMVLMLAVGVYLPMWNMTSFGKGH
jgi:MSHA biogenesis protein MshG